MIFKSFSFIKTNINRNFKYSDKMGVMSLANKVFKEVSRDLKLFNNYIYNPEDNIQVSISYFKSLYDAFNIYDIDFVNRIKLMILAYE